MRQTVEFESHGTRCAAWWYRPEAPGPVPVVVMGHGLGCVKEMRLDAYAERYVAAGYACLAFDYRHFGDSGGEPRQLLDIGRQLEDWQAAVAHARTLDGADPDRVVLWGASLSGGHVIRVAAADPRVAAVVAQVPHVSGIASLRSEKLSMVARLSAHGVYDAVRGLFGRSPHYVLSSGDDVELGLVNAPGESAGYLGLMPEDAEIDRRVAARFALSIGFYSPGRALPTLTMPALLQVGTGDLTTPARPVVDACDRAPTATLKEYPAGHFQLFEEPLFSTVVQDQLDFLSRTLGGGPSAAPASEADWG